MDDRRAQDGPPFWTERDHPVCWRCMEERVPQPLLLCARCARNESQRGTYERSAKTHERTHEKAREPLEKADDLAYRRWSDLTEN